MSKMLNFGGKTMKTTQMRTSGVYLFRGAVARGSATITCVGQRLQGRQGSGTASGVLWLEAVAMGTLEVAD